MFYWRNIYKRDRYRHIAIFTNDDFCPRLKIVHTKMFTDILQMQTKES